MDPLTDFETDFLPKMTLAKTGWKAKELVFFKDKLCFLWLQMCSSL